MKKIYLLAAGIILIVLIVTSLILSMRKTASNTAGAPFPTSIPGQGLSRQTGQLSTSTTTEETISQNQAADISTIAPVETEDFSLAYSPSLNKVVVEKKTPQAEAQLASWAAENQKTELVTNPDLTLIVDQDKNPADYNPLVEFLNIFLNFGQGVGGTAGTSSSTNSTVSTDSTNPTDLTGSTGSTSFTSPKFTYYPQCGGEFDDLPLPGGCNLCKAGCGPTTVAMIASSYLGNNFTPRTIVNLYQSKGYTLGCSGSTYVDAKNLLTQLGLKTTDPIVFNLEGASKVVPDLRKYLDAGWTFFAWANFRENGGGHFFWITDIDNRGNIFAYDPYYGRFEIPYNENSRSPYPLYKVAFGVKK